MKNYLSNNVYKEVKRKKKNKIKSKSLRKKYNQFYSALHLAEAKNIYKDSSYGCSQTTYSGGKPIY